MNGQNITITAHVALLIALDGPKSIAENVEYSERSVLVYRCQETQENLIGESATEG
jgi:hypothetical protein